MGVLFENGMALPSKAFDIWRRLYGRFEIEPGPAIGSAPEVATSIIPVTLVDELLKQAKAMVSPSMDLSGGGSATITAFRVPIGERWTVYRLFRSSTVAGSRLRLIDPLNDNIILTLAGTAEEVVEIGSPFVLEESWVIGMQETGNGGDTSESVHALVTVEAAF